MVSLIHVPALVAIMLLVPERGAQPLGGGGLIAWPASFAVLFWTLNRQRQDGIAMADAARYWTGWILVAILATREVIWQLDHQQYLWAMGLSALGMIGGYARFRLRERDVEDAAPISIAILAWGAGFWFVSGLGWIDDRIAAVAAVAANLVFVTASCALFEAAGRVGDWAAPRRATLLLAAAMVIAAVLQHEHGEHPFASHGWAAWPFALAALYWILHRQERDELAVFGSVQHVLALWLGVLVIAWETAWQFQDHDFGRAWAVAAWGLVPAVAIRGVSQFNARAAWPFGVHFELYQRIALTPLVALMVTWSLYSNLAHPGTMAPLPYLPVLNPLDIAQITALWAAWRWCGTFEEEPGPMRIGFAPVIAGLAFLWVNCVMLRSIHYWADVDYTLDALFRSVLVQSALSLLWTAMALVLMLRATRNAQRRLWLVGAVLLGVVVGKLFLLDLANTGTVERIITFIGVGIGLLAIGYLAPVPPGGKEEDAA
jgi:uncharacterized membrane protein